MRTAVIYARFSCSKQREASIEDQLRVCTEWCQREGYEIVAQYCDYAISGRTDDRPEFQRMIQNAGESDIVLVYMMDRFSRDAYDAPIYKKRLREKGVKVVSATEPLNDSPDAILLEKIYEGLAAVESAHISQRTKRGMHGNALKCMHNGVRVYGYDFADDGRYTINESEAAIVRECFARKIDGEPVNSIANDLARRGVQTYTGRPAGYTFAYNLLRNEKYTGVYAWGDVRVENGMPQIIDKDVFMMAQNTHPRKQRSNETWRDYPLSGKTICAGCGRNLIGVSARGRNNVRYSYYQCSNKCGAKPVRAEILESEVVSHVRELLADRETALEIANVVSRYAGSSDAKRKLDDALKRRETASKAVSNLTRAVAQGMEYSLVRDDLERYQAQIDVADKEITVYQTAPSFDAEDFADFLQFGATLDDSKLIDAMIYQVMVGSEDVIVTLNYDKESEPARFRFPLVREDCGWLPIGETARNMVGVSCGLVLLRFPRVA